jgi:septal ring factor EnvC (AmiA/AmiB activator)
MMCLVRLKNINILLLAVLLLWSCMCAVCGATEKTYTITESQLTQLETNLTKLKEQNKILQEQLQVSQKQVQNLKTQSEQLQKQVQTLNQSLTNANQLLTRYEKQINEEKNCAIGLGIGNNGIAIAGDIKNTWIIADEKTVILGYKFKF